MQFKKIRFVIIVSIIMATFALFIPPALAAEIPWGAPVTVDGNFDGATDVHAADLDGDGDLDLVGAAQTEGIYWWENTAGDGSAWTASAIGGAGDVRAVTTGDLDGDGDLDIIVADYSGGYIAWFENDSGDASAWTGDLVSSVFIYGVTSVQAADIDGDGDLDLVVAASTDDQIIWIENSGGDATLWSVTTVASSFDGANSVSVADLDGDGDLDILGAATVADDITWWENDGAGGGWTERPVAGSFDGAESVYAADLDGDGDVDVLGAAFSSHGYDIRWWENDGTPRDGGWTSRTVAGGFDGANSAYAADLDGDGDLDVLGVATAAAALTWWENDGTPQDGGWTERLIDGAFDGAASASAADLDGDGDLDVFGAATVADDIIWWENQTLHRNATFPNPAGEHLVDGAFDGAVSVYAADLDGDGDLDVLGAAMHADAITWWENDGNGGGWTAHLVDGAFDGAYSVYAADLDGDGDVDVLGAAYYADDITWWENTNGAGTAWTAHLVDGAFDGAYSVYAADLDGDGDVDVLGAAFDADDITWWENTNGAGTAWTAHLVDGDFNGAASVSAADLDGDGDLDVLGAAYYADDITWWENLGGFGMFWMPHLVEGDFNEAASVYAADLDGDGDLDVLGAAQSDREITWWENDGTPQDGGWTEHLVAGGFAYPLDVSAADLDGDGDLDVLGTGYFAHLTWWENDGTPQDGGWIAHLVDGDYVQVTEVSAADVDGDGDLDVLGAVPAADNITWWENRGGQFGLDTSDTTPAAMESGATDDLLRITARHNGRAGDGDLELASLELLFEESAGDPLTSAEANALVANLYIYQDDGSGAFEAGSDTLVTTVDTLALTDGEQAVAFTDGDAHAQVAYGAPQTYFVVVEIDANAVIHPPAQLRIIHLTESSSRAEDRDHDLPLRLEYASNTASGLLTFRADTLYLAPDVPTCMSNSPCATNSQDILNCLNDGGTLIVLGTNDVPETLAGTGRAVTITGQNGGALDWSGGSGALFSFGSETGSISGITLSCTSNCAGSQALAQTGGALTVHDITLTGFATAFYQTGGTLTAYDNTLSGTGTAFQTGGDATVYGNTLSGFATAFSQSGGTLTAYANNLSGFSTALAQTGGTAMLAHNYWGAAFLPDIPAGLDPLTWYQRLGAPVASVAFGAGSATLGDAEISGGTGTAVIVSHGRGPAAAPFGNGSTPAAEMCSDYYDFFTLNGSGNWTVAIPVDAEARCDDTYNTSKAFWALDLTQCVLSNDPDCWDAHSGVTPAAGPPRRLVIAGVPTSYLLGSPFAAGDQAGADPTALTLQSFATRYPGRAVAGLLVAAVWSFSVGAAGLGGWRLWRKKLR